MLRALRLTWVTATVLAASALAQPRLGPLVEVHRGTETEPLAFYNFGTWLTASADQYVLTWNDDRSSFSQLYAAVLDGDGGVVVPGTRLLVTHKDLPDVGGAVGCKRGSDFVFAVTSSTLATGFLITDDQLRRRRFESVNANAVGSALECGNSPVLWAYPEVYYPAGPVAHFALHVFGLDADAGLIELDGGNPFVADLNVATEDGLGPDFASTGALTLMVFSGNLDAGPDGLDVYGAFLTGPDLGAPFLIAGGPGRQANPSVAWNGGASFFVGYEDGLAPLRDLQLARVSLTGTVLAGGAEAATAEDEYAPRLDFAGTFIGATWLSGAPKPNSLWMDVAPSPGMPLLLRTDEVDEPHLGSARDGEVLVQYRDFTRGIRSVGQLVRGGVAGAVVDPTVTLRAQIEPHLIGAEPGPIVTWTEDGRRFAFGLATDAGTAFTGGELGPHLGGGPHGVAVVYPGLTTQAQLLDDRTLQTRSPLVTFPNTNNIVETSVPFATGNGFTFATATQITPAQFDLILDQLLPDGGLGAHLRTAYMLPEVFNLSVAWAGASDTTAISWSEHRVVHVQCVRSFDGITPSLGPVRTVNTGHYEARPRITSSGTDFFVTWVSELATPPYTPLAMGQRLDANCQNVGPALVLGEAVDPWNSWPTVVFDGLQYVVLWVSNTDVMGDVVGVRLLSDGGVSPAFPVVQSADSDVEPSVISLGPGHWGVAFTHFFPDDNKSARRVFYRTIDSDSIGTTCENGTQCASGVCSSGVCCDRPCNSAGDSCETCAETGICRPKSANFECRPSGAACDTAEVCDGVSVSCPPDTSGMTCTLCSSTPAVFPVECRVNFTLPSSALPMPAGGMPITYGLRTCDGSALPNGLSISQTTGALTWSQPPDAAGPTRVLIVAQSPSESATATIELDLGCTPDAGTDGGMQSDGGLARRRMNVGCGCEASSALVFVLAVLLLRKRHPRWNA